MDPGFPDLSFLMTHNNTAEQHHFIHMDIKAQVEAPCQRPQSNLSIKTTCLGAVSAFPLPGDLGDFRRQAGMPSTTEPINHLGQENKGANLGAFYL